ncbi:MAG: hypothetical protein EOP20_11935 [Hyphomicrobiales bacterium]|nr:MAG: hypothetical protein EOP20_11935 [Hyphomicrobiales bacterium]
MTTSRVQSAARVIFGPAEAIAVIAELDERFSADNPVYDGALEPHLAERIAAAALKMSEGSLEKFGAAIKLAVKDWRDLLMAAGFGHDVSAHEAWFRQLPHQEPKVR